MPYQPQSANRLTERIHAVVRSAMERAELSHILVACSGGADSTCLLHAVATVARQTGLRVTVCHVRHGVRMDDARDADVVRATARGLDVECRVVSLRLSRADETRVPSEVAMREARYRAFAAVSDAIKADAVLTGHTRDDQAETVLLHLLRGAGIDGLGGMGEETMLTLSASIENGGPGAHLRIVRPLLTVRRDETERYCVAHHLTVVSDPTNADRRYTRNWLRHAILPALRERNPEIGSVLARAASIIRDDAAFLATETANAMLRCECTAEQSCLTVNQSAFVSEHVALRRRIVREILQRVTGTMPRAADVEALQHHAVTSRSSAIRHFGGVACCRAFGRLAFGCDEDLARWVRVTASRRYPLSQEVQEVRRDTNLHLSLADPSVEVYTVRIERAHDIPRESIRYGTIAMRLRLPDGFDAVIRNRVPGDRFRPSGSERPMLLRAYLAAGGVPAPVRDLLPLLVVNDTIAWVIGHDVGATFAATAGAATHVGIVTRVTGYAHERIGGTDGSGATADTGNSEYADVGTFDRSDDRGESR